MLRITKTVYVLLSAMLLANSAHASDKPASMKLCYENEDVYPWVLKDRPGLNIVFMNALAQKLGIKFDMQSRPWKRCLDELKSGEMDGLFSASFKADRLENGAYPMTGDKPDETKAIMLDGYTLYRVKGSAVNWDGKKLTVAGAVGAQPGYSIIDQLKSLGAKVDDGSRSADDNLRKLIAGRVDAVALITLEGENSIRNNPEFASKVEAVQPVLVSKPYYLMLSKQFVAKYPEYAKEIWSGVAAIRESADYKAKAAVFK